MARYLSRNEKGGRALALKLEKGVYALGQGGLPLENTPLAEALQNAALRLAIPKGSFPYAREWGSRLGEVNPQAEHALEHAVSLAKEALLEAPGVTAESAEFLESGGIRFVISTPLGKGEVIYGDV